MARKSQYLSYGGISDTYRGWGIRLGIDWRTLYRRHKRLGWPVHRVITTTAQQAEIARVKAIVRTRYASYTVAGVRDSIAGHARRYGLAPTTVRSRMADGWTLERALKAPVVRSAWLTWEDRLLRKNLDRTTEWLVEQLPRHPYSSVQTRRNKLAAEARRECGLKIDRMARSTAKNQHESDLNCKPVVGPTPHEKNGIFPLNPQ